MGEYVSNIMVKFFGFEFRTGLGFVAILILILFVGMLARNYFGRKLIELGEWILKSIPFVNKVYNATQQISRAFISEKREVFKKAVLIEYPRKGIYSIGFLTRDTGGEVKEKIEEDTVSIFLPSTPNPTTGFILFVPKKDLVELDMSIEDSLKLIISFGAVLPEYTVEVLKQNKNKISDLKKLQT
ncbi:MAG: DUF502 domain-containing protein [Candidatus Helarchaeota archaeon]|nr:DUF502 domain-containing protein [Candidatus Helarchaeota archaeon]